MLSYVTIIIPVRNEEKTIKRCLDSILALDYPNFEVIIINDGSTDRTGEILQGYLSNQKKIKIIESEGVGPSEARNLGIKLARGEFVAFTDADCIVHKEWLNELLKGFTDENVVGVGGNQLSPEDETYFGRDVQNFMKMIGFMTHYIKKDGFTIVESKNNPTCNEMYRRKIFYEVGGFLSGFWPGEDTELDYRIKKKGYKLSHNPRAIVYHYRSENIREYRKMMHNYGKAQAYLIKKYGFFRRIHYVPIVTLVFLITEVFIFLKFPFMGILLMALIFVTLTLYFLFNTNDPRKIFRYFELFFVTLLFWNLGFLKQIIKNKW